MTVKGSKAFRGRYVHLTWQHDPSVYAPARYRRACSYDAFVPDALERLTLKLDAEIAGAVSDAEALVSALNQSAAPELAPLARLLLRTESIASSKIEGMQIETLTLARAEARHEAGRSISREAAEILANVDAMQLAIEEAAAPGPLTRDQVIEVHRALMKNAPNAHVSGLVRTTQNWIGGNEYNPCGADFVPPPPEEVDRLLDDLVAFCNEEVLPPLVQAALAHAQFETIHPFADGNGRTGRALVHILLRRRRLARSYVPPISVVLAARRDRYIEGLNAFRDGRLMSWIETFAAASARAAELASAYLSDVRALQERWREQLRSSVSPRSDAAAWSLIEVLPAHPVITVSVGVAATSRTRPAVGQALDQLVSAGVLAPLGSGRRNQMWEAPDLLTLLERFESTDPMMFRTLGKP
jgi:Fic family protein